MSMSEYFMSVFSASEPNKNTVVVSGLIWRKIVVIICSLIARGTFSDFPDLRFREDFSDVSSMLFKLSGIVRLLVMSLLILMFFKRYFGRNRVSS